MARRSMQVEAVLAMDAKRFLAAIRRASADTKRLGQATKQANRSGFNGLAKSAIKAAAATASLYTVYNQGKKAVETTKDLAKGTIQLTRTTGLSTKEASRFVAITKVRGIETTKLATTFTILSKQIVAAQDGSEKAVSSFKKLGVSQEAIKRGDTKQVFLDAADGLSKMANGANKTALAAQLFGRGYQALFPLLDLGSKGIAEQLQLAGDLGAELSGNSVSSFKKYAEAERKAQLAIMGFRLQVGTYLIPKLTEGIAIFSDWVAQFKKGEGPIAKGRDAIVGFYNTIKPLVSLLVNHPDVVKNAALAYIGFRATMAGLNLFNAFLIAAGSAGQYTAAGRTRGVAFAKGIKGAGIIGGMFAVAEYGPSIDRFQQDLFTRLRRSVPGLKILGNDFIDALGSGLIGSPLGPSFSTAIRLARATAKQTQGGPMEDLGAFFSKVMGRGIRKGAPTVYSSLSSLMDKLKKNGLTRAQAFGTIGTTAAGKVAAGIRDEENRVKNALSSVIAAAKKKGIISASAFGPIGARMTEGLTSGIRSGIQSVINAMVDAVNRARDEAKRASKQKSPSLVFAEIGAGLVQGLAVGIKSSAPLASKAITKVMTATASAASPFDLAQSLGFGGDFGVATAEAALAKAKKAPKGKAKSKTRQRFDKGVKTAEAGLAKAEGSRDAATKRRDALEQVRSFISQLVDTAKTNFLKPITDAINARSAARGDRADTRSRAEIARRLGRAQTAESDPKQREFLNRQKTRLAAQLSAAERRGDTERIAALQEELFDINRKLSKDYVSELEDELAEFDDSVLLKKAENAAEVLGAQLQAQLDGAFNTLAGGGGVTAFLTQFGAALSAQLITALGTTSAAALGLTPSAALGGGIGEAVATAGGAGTIPKAPTPPTLPLKTQIKNYLKGKSKGPTYEAKKIAAALSPKSTQKKVFDLTGKEFAGYKIANKASGGRLTPGMLTMVGETGPEMIVGGNVMSGTRTARSRGANGTNITINATGAAADNPQLLARELGWQLATR